jgi:hypothetical protein
VLTLVNVNPSEAREVVVQGGAYAEHQFASVEAGEKSIPIDRSSFAVRLAPGAGQRLTIHMRRYANAPTLSAPWDR